MILTSMNIMPEQQEQLSRATKLLPDHGAEVIAKLTETDYLRSPLVQDGLKFPSIQVAKMTGYSVRNHMLLQKYLELVNDLYAEPNKEKTLGSFMVPCIESEQKRTALVSRKKGRISKQNTATQGADIRSLFRRIENQNREQNNELQGEIKPEEDSIIAKD